MKSGIKCGQNWGHSGGWGHESGHQLVSICLSLSAARFLYPIVFELYYWF
nr:MAG TPA: Copper binding octapeptide repeat protein [Caudoviricetes sp.]